MRKFKRLVTHALLFVLSTLLLKALLPATDFNDCNEFAHIHKFTISKMFAKESSATIHSSKGTSQNHEDDNCHEAQSLFSASLVPVRVFVGIRPLPKTVFKFVSKLENRFKSPDLDAPRRPPRYA